LGANSRFAYMSNIENYIGNGDLADAQALVSTCPPAMPMYDPATGVVIADSSGAGHVVHNYRKFYQVLINYLGGNITPDDKDTLAALAGLCPVLNGTVVYQARSLYAMVFNTANVFNDESCEVKERDKSSESNNSGQSYQQSPPVNLFLQRQKYTVYPNPNNGNMILLQKVADANPVKLEILNAIGQIVYSDELYFKANKVPLNIQGIVPGLYVVQLRDSNGNCFILRFVISG
jgi:hypothetical protein